MREGAPLLLSSSSIQAGLNSKASPFQPKSWIRLSMSLDGRDKITKLLQYICRFLAWYWTNKSSQNNKKHSATVVWQRSALLLYKQLAASRKAFRLGRSLVELEKLYSMKDQLCQTVKDYFNMKASCTPISFPHTNQNNDYSMSSLVMTWAAAIKILGLAGFWAADNINFLTMTGCLDDFYLGTTTMSPLTRKERDERRSSRQKLFSVWANRSYFYGSMAGLVANFVAYRKHGLRLAQATKTHNHHHQRHDEGSTPPLPITESTLQKDTTAAYNYDSEEWIRAKEKECTLFFMLVKSMADVLVFSNNPGLDFWENLLGYKLHEGVHCFGGMISAAVVLYNNYPNQKYS